MSLWGRMRLLVHRGQVLLLLVVGVLAGIAVAGVCLELCGVSVLGLFKVNELFVQPRSDLPSQIVIAGAAAPDPPAPLPANTTVAAGSVQPTPPTPTAAVVPGAVYTWPTDGGGGGGRGGGHGGRDG